MSTQPTVTGIDFGSSQVKIGAISKGAVQIITNQANFRQTPNVIGYGNKERLVGEAGQVKIKSNHSNTIIAPNRYLGFNLNNQYTQQQLKFCPAKAKFSQEDKSTLKFSLLQGQQKRSFTSEQLTATFLTQIQKIISQTNNLSNKNMVITVPSYYSQHEKQALLNSVKIAQKKVKPQYSTQIVSQQIAASMDFGFGKRHQFQKEDSKAKNVLFVDFGHSKCSLFVTSFNNDHMKIIAKKFNRKMGCKNLDQKLLQFYANLFDSRNSSASMNLMENKKSVLKLLESIQKQRKVLSGVSENDLNIECILEDYDLSYTMKRQEFEKICLPITLKFKQLLEDFLGEIRQMNININHIELIGGGTRIPVIIKLIEQVYGVEPSRTLNSNECIARGAALISAMNSSIFKTHPYSYIQVSPYSLNISATNGSYQLASLIQKGQFIPRQKQIQVNNFSEGGKVQFTVEYDQLQPGIETRALSFQVTLAQNQIGKMQNQMKDQSEQNKTSSNRLNFIFQFDHNGLVNIQKVLQNGKKLKINTINNYEKITKAQLSEFETNQKTMALNDLLFKNLYQKKNQFQATIYLVRDQIQKIFNSQQYKDFFDENQSKQSTKIVQDNKEWIQTQECDRIQQFQKKAIQIKERSKNLIQSVKLNKDRYLAFVKQLQTFGSWFNNTIKQRKHVPQQINQIRQWFNLITRKFNQQPKFEQPSVSIQELKQVAHKVQLKLKEFDQQNLKRSRQGYQNNYSRHHPSSYRPQQSSFNQFGGQSQFQPRSTKNTTRNKQFGGGFFDGGFSGFF